jgi:DNA-binding MarR family transcriptional regulator
VSVITDSQPDRSDPRTQLEREVRSAIARAVLFNESVVARVGMSSSEMQTLHLLRLNGPLSPGRLAELMDLSTGTVTGVLDRLERLGLVTRQRHPDDRRKILVTLDEAGLAATLAPYYVEKGDLLAGAVAGCTEEEVLTVLAFFRRLNDSPAS